MYLQPKMKYGEKFEGSKSECENTVMFSEVHLKIALGEQDALN